MRFFTGLMVVVEELNQYIYIYTHDDVYNFLEL